MKKAIGTVKKIVILVLVLVVPGFLYYLLTSQGKNRYKPLPFFGPKQIAKTAHSVHGKLIPDTIYHTVPDFSLLDQNGAPVTQSSFNKKIVIVDFFYTHCPSVCNIVSDNIKTLLSEYEKNKLICFVSVTVDPKNDSPAALRNYAKRFGPSDKWLFLTGDTSTVYNLARKGFLVDALQTGSGEFIYSDKLILMDSDKHIRGYYTGASTADVSRLDDEIKVLISEELRKNDTPLY
jgi:protein SCO1/2